MRKRPPYAKRVATLLAIVAYLEGEATDDALELFDVVMTSQLLARAQRQSAKDQAKRYPRVSRAASKLAAAVGVLLEATELDQDMPLDRNTGLAKLDACEADALLLAVSGLERIGQADWMFSPQFPSYPHSFLSYGQRRLIAAGVP